MIFSELYSAYYNAVAGILSDIIQGKTSDKELQKNVDKYAFSESVLTILPSLKSEKWQLVKSDMTTPVKNTPSMPVTLLEKRWLKAISLDPRIRLFDVAFEGLDDIEPLFTQEDYVVYDKYGDGDPYDDEGFASVNEKQPNRATVTLKICNERNALERTMLHFAHFEKRAEKIDDDNYIVHITYDKDDETEVVIRILGFGPMVEVVESGRFRELIIERLRKQMSCELF